MENPDDDNPEGAPDRLERWFWKVVAAYMAGMALGIAIGAIIVIIIITVYLYLEIH